jgi:hypothetical protein
MRAMMMGDGFLWYKMEADCVIDALPKKSVSTKFGE